MPTVSRVLPLASVTSGPLLAGRALRPGVLDPSSESRLDLRAKVKKKKIPTEHLEVHALPFKRQQWIIKCLYNYPGSLSRSFATGLL